MKDARARAYDPFDKLLDVYGCVGSERIGFLPPIKRPDRLAHTLLAKLGTFGSQKHFDRCFELRNRRIKTRKIRRARR